MFEVTLTFDNGPEPPAMPMVLDVREHTISNPIDCKLLAYITRRWLAH
jgi:hypothetical protein